MNVAAVKKFCITFNNALEVRMGPPNNILAYIIGDKKFAYFKTNEPEKWRFSIRVTPERFLELTDQPGVKPARYMHRFHWVTIVDVNQFNEDYLSELILWSYNKALQSLPKKQQTALST